MLSSSSGALLDKAGFRLGTPPSANEQAVGSCCEEARSNAAWATGPCATGLAALNLRLHKHELVRPGQLRMLTETTTNNQPDICHCFQLTAKRHRQRGQHAPGRSANPDAREGIVHVA